MGVKLYEFGTIPELLIKYVVILVRHQDKWVLSMHKERTTWEFAGGHREKGESLDEAASRELFEETGAVDFSIVPVSVYSVTRDNDAESFGQLYLATVSKFDQLPDYEMSEVRRFEHIPDNLTYPLIYPALIEAVMPHIVVSPRQTKYDFNRRWLTKKFEEIQRRLLKAIQQLNVDQLNWRQNQYSHSIPDLLRHIQVNMHVRVLEGIMKDEVTKDRSVNSDRVWMTMSEAEMLINTTVQTIIELIENVADETLEDFQIVRGKQRSNLDMLHQCAAHYSEHMGQIFYITKMIIQSEYKSTSV